MQRKTFNLPLLDGNIYTFSERNKEDSDNTAILKRIRSARIKFIRDEFKDSEQLTEWFLMQEVNKIYSDKEAEQYYAELIYSTHDERLRIAYDSFKIENKDLLIENFEALVDKKLLHQVLKQLNEIEKPEESTDLEVAQALGLPIKNKVCKILVDMNKNHPAAYRYLKQNVKKNKPVAELNPT